MARASAIIDVVAAGDTEGVGLAAVCQVTGLNKTTAFNLLSSLVTLRFIDQDAQSRLYRLGIRNIELGRMAQHRLHIPELARPILVNLCKKTNETVSLALPDHAYLLVVDSISGSKLLRSTAYVGSRSLYHCTALGKSVLAYRSDKMRHAIYRMCEFPSLTTYTITDADTFEAQLRQIRAQGYAIDAEENEIGVTCVGTVVFDGFGDIAAAISVTGPTHRWPADTIAQCAEDVIAAANMISEAMGYEERPDNQGSGER